MESALNLQIQVSEVKGDRGQRSEIGGGNQKRRTLNSEGATPKSAKRLRAERESGGDLTGLTIQRVERRRIV
jgi:hypothetical protein